MQKTHLRPIAFAALAAFTVFGASQWMSAPRAAQAPQGAKPVAVVKVARGDLQRAITISAELRPFEEADLHAKVAGYLKTIKVDIGDHVKAGQVIATLDVEELHNDLAHANAAFHDAQLSYDRVRQVIAKRPELLAQEEVDRAQAAFEMAKANREHAATMVGYATIAAPFDGLITKRYADPGALIQAGTNSSSQAMPVVHIAQDSKLRLSFPVPESVVPQVPQGTPVTVSVGATGQTFQGSIVRTSGKVDTTTRTMEAEVDLDNRDRRIAPGMYASARVVLEQKAGVLSLPIQAVSTGAHPTVWRVGAGGIVEDVPVTTGMQTDARVEIVHGLADGDQVVFGSRNVTNVGDTVAPKLVASDQ